jgi:hypothetical protein
MRLESTMKCAVAFLLVSAWSAHAAASTSFPSAVDQHLKLTGSATIEHAVAPPDGCLLCHKTESGGFGTNNAFGAELRQHGVVGAEPSTVGPALDALEAADPHAIDDIVMGLNPNDDHSTPTAALPQPEYGCAVAPEPRATREGSAASLSMCVALLLARRARRSRRR